eukprot:c52770_g1_i1.p1 GENE.c52770_g1_i1~~c52770_g1_i1.p1  ORF type:complete len:306 (+),score=60.69 c52770_g1_i1:66-920(+)
MVQAKKGGPEELLKGATLQCIEAATLGMPLEVWKTHMAANRTESTLQAFGSVYKQRGLYGFWRGTSAKMIESASKGAILLWSKEFILGVAQNSGMNNTVAGILAGAGGGVCQVTVMGPCTFIVTAAVTGDKSVGIWQHVRTAWTSKGIKGFYPGGTAIAFRQATNWASRQGFTEFVRDRMKIVIHGSKDARLTVPQEAMSGIIGGALACWNHPFEVARVEAQAAAAAGRPSNGMIQVLKNVVRENGWAGLYAGVVPRIGLGIWQTLFMVTGVKLVDRVLNPNAK